MVHVVVEVGRVVEGDQVLLGDHDGAGLPTGVLLCCPSGRDAWLLSVARRLVAGRVSLGVGRAVAAAFDAARASGAAARSCRGAACTSRRALRACAAPAEFTSSPSRRFVSGQRCTASSRLIVTEGIHDRFVAALVERIGRDFGMMLSVIGDGKGGAWFTQGALYHVSGGGEKGEQAHALRGSIRPGGAAGRRVRSTAAGGAGAAVVWSTHRRDCPISRLCVK